MNISRLILPALTSLFLLNSPVSSAAKPEQASEMYIANKITSENLHGFWGNAVENEEGALINTTIFNPDNTGTDIAIMSFKATNKIFTIRQDFNWTFDEKKQEIHQTVTDYKTSINGKEEQNKQKIGEKSTIKARILIIKGLLGMLELTDKASGNQTSYFKQDPDKILNHLENSKKTHP